MTQVERYIKAETRRQLAFRGLSGPPEHTAESTPIERVTGDEYRFKDEVVKHPEEDFFTRAEIALRQFKWWELLILGGATVAGCAVLWQVVKPGPKQESKQEVRFLEPVNTVDTPAD